MLNPLGYFNPSFAENVLPPPLAFQRRLHDDSPEE